MKKIVLLTTAIVTSFSGFAQNRSAATPSGQKAISSIPSFNVGNTLGKSTAEGDTFAFTHITTGDTVTFYYVGGSPYDSGYLNGTNAYDDKAFAERYDFYSPDSSIKVAGVISRFGGTWSQSSTNTVTFKVWTQGPKTAITGNPLYYWSGFPNTELASEQVGITQLRMGVGSAPDTQKLTWFTTPTNYLNDSFFVGYQLNYTFASANGDTIALYGDQQGERNDAVPFTVQNGDTIWQVRNATQYSDNTWNDNFQVATNLYHNLEILPVFIVHITTGVNGISKNNFTLFGNYPNPATNSTNVKYALKAATTISVSVMDVTGRVISTINEGTVASGDHEVTIPTSQLAAGNYVYVIRTGEGDAMAAQFTVAK